MIIVPTEKQFDWRHAPVVLFIFVTLNVLLFFLYQSGDHKKFALAITAYERAGFLEVEWPLFENFLGQQKQTELLNEYRQEYKDQQWGELASTILLREDFYVYLQQQARREFNRDLYDQWDIERARINKQIQSMSYLAYGLRADRLSIPTFITHQFLHGGIMHLLGNMFFLIVCGFAVEAAIGHWRFLAFYLVSGVVAGISQCAFNWNSSSPLIGASGAISGVMAMYLAIFRLKKIEFFYWFFFFVGYFRAPALLILPLYIGKEVHSYLTDTESNVAFMAHAGGFVAGALLIGVAFLFNRNVINRTYVESDADYDPYQERLAAIYEAIEKFRFERAMSLVEKEIEEHGVNEELAVLRYNLLKINRGDAYLSAVQSLLTLPPSLATNIKKLDKVWKDNPEAHHLLDQQQLLKLGIQLAALDDPSSAEQIFTRLQETHCRDSSMSVLATKLARTFAALNDVPRKTHYDKLAVQMAQYGVR